jgi:nucleotide-binding universal stress UspA family protein
MELGLSAPLACLPEITGPASATLINCPAICYKKVNRINTNQWTGVAWPGFSKKWRLPMSQKKILVAVDGSDYSYAVLDKAIEYARLLNARVVFVHCHRKFPTIKGQPQKDKEISDIINETETLTTPLLQYLERAKIPVEKRLMEEPAGAVISDVARIEKCELVVMGSRGLTNLASMIVGSVTNRVLQTAPCSVLVVR